MSENNTQIDPSTAINIAVEQRAEEIAADKIAIANDAMEIADIRIENAEVRVDEAIEQAEKAIEKSEIQTLLERFDTWTVAQNIVMDGMRETLSRQEAIINSQNTMIQSLLTIFEVSAAAMMEGPSSSIPSNSEHPKPEPINPADVEGQPKAEEAPPPAPKQRRAKFL
jgi:hypothetical protein